MTGWIIGYAIGLVVVVVLVVLVVTILRLAHSIGQEATMIDDALLQSVDNTAALTKLHTTIEHAEIIVAGLHRGRTRLGG
ncbi:MAG TPA: hypothetical protein VFX16_37060 [Pseudonocardiaceae bacterium]|nr:hypothetical protein [Pseudonocardiaceae bacterium]